MSVNARNSTAIGTSLAANPEPWWDRALCKGLAVKNVGSPMDPRQEGETTKEATTRHAEAERKYCRRCPVKNECLIDGIKSEGYGMFGGKVLRMGSEEHNCRGCGVQITAHKIKWCSRKCQAAGENPDLELEAVS